LGAERPTLTDANVVLGRINADRPIGGGQTKLDVEAARQAILKHVGAPLGLGAVDAAGAIVRVANGRMAGAIRLVSIERGHDPGRFAIMPFGGGGALHAGALIAEVGLKRAIVPRFPGITSALGCVIADLRHDRVETVNMILDGLDVDALEARMISSGESARAVVQEAGVAVERIDVIYELDMHYQGQTHTISAPLPTASETVGVALNAGVVRAAFETSYRRHFSRLLPDIPVRIVSLRTAAVGRRPPFDLSALKPAQGLTVDAARRGKRPIWFAGEWLISAIWSRLDLPSGAVIEGPAVLEQSDATTLIDPGLVAQVDDIGNLIIEPASP
jgi:N-methylhydantoinase A